jgi:hypothetical protein
MPTEAGSLEDVEAWAEHEFPTYFAALSTFPLSFHVGTSIFDGEYTDGKIVLQNVLISSLHIGVTDAGRSVYARITGCNDVELFCDHRVKAAEDTKELRYIKPVVGLDGIELAAPFSYCAETGHPACIDRLETLIRYAYLGSGEEEAVRPKLGFFKAHFRGACRDVARGTGASAGADEMEDNDTLPGMYQDRNHTSVHTLTVYLQLTRLPVSSRTPIQAGSTIIQPQHPSSTSMCTPWTRAITISR